MYILGINCYSHDASAALVKDGVILGVIEEERLSREKHSAKFPRLAIQKLLEMEGITIHQVEKFTYFYNPWLELSSNIAYFSRYFPAVLNLFRTPSGSGGLKIFPRLKLQWGVGRLLQQEFGLKSAPKVEFIEHHLCHAASAFYGSGFEESAILTWDGRGESTTTLLAVGRGNKIEKIDEICIPHSLGHLYASVTDYLGFKSFNDEGKVMGMAAYGRDTYLSRFREVLRLEEKGRFNLNLEYFRFHTHGRTQWLSDKFLRSFGPPHGLKDKIEQRHFDVAYALQKTVEEAGVHVARHLYEMTRLPSLCMTGGVALNVLLNQRVVEKTPFERFFIQPVANDSGTSFGSALYYYHHTMDHKRSHSFETPYLGPGYSNEEIETELRAANVNYVRSENIERDTVRHIYEGKIVGWFQGRMEAGPRALGNRSIVVNPMDPGMKSRLNERVKKRESFRPFAPSVLEERVDEFFEMPKGQMSPYMILSGSVRPEKRAVIPAVTHLDNTARVHTVSQKSNPRYWKLIHEFEKLSGVGVLLNTSFNENEPIVCSPRDAIRCFLRTEFDVLGIGDFLVIK